MWSPATRRLFSQAILMQRLQHVSGSEQDRESHIQGYIALLADLLGCLMKFGVRPYPLRASFNHL